MKRMGLIGKKLGRTQMFDEAGTISRVTAIQVGPCTIVDKRTSERDGYTALVLGFGARRPKHVSKPLAGFFKKANVEPAQVLREFRIDEEALGKFEVGQVLKPSEQFEVGQYVDVSGTSKGRGFAGVMKRWGHAGSATDTHGTHEYKRHGGSIGTRKTPGRTFPGTKMAGHYGNANVTVQNLRVTGIYDDEHVVCVEGSVPGARNAIVTVRVAAKG
jgi:large subunit ribosomal protein L3